jgi:hypothetical protein
MLAAARNPSGPLGLVRLVFSLVGAREANISDGLKEHIVAVIHQAQGLARDPESFEGTIYPEAIELAIQMRTERSFGDSISKISDFASIEPDLARQLLKRIDHLSAA